MCVYLPKASVLVEVSVAAAIQQLQLGLAFPRRERVKVHMTFSVTKKYSTFTLILFNI